MQRWYPAFMLACGGAGALSLLLTPLVRRAAVALGVLDHPNARKIHVSPVPRLGGVAVGVAVAFAVLAAFQSSAALRTALFGDAGVVRWAVLAGAAAAILVAGAVDDARGLPATVKLLFELVAAAAVVFVAHAPRAVALGPATAPVPLGVAGAVLGVLWIVGLANAVNMTDVADGVAGGIGAICALSLAFVGLALHRVVAPLVLFALAGALLGFLPHNLRARRIFLGDSGSLVIGFLLGAASLVGLERDGVWLVLPAALALGMPVAEGALTVTRRALRAVTVERAAAPRERLVLHRSPPGFFTPDARHIPHQLLRLGLSQGAALALLYAIAAVLGGLAVASVRWPHFGLWSACAAGAALLYAAARWWYDELRLLDRGALIPLFDNRVMHSRVVHQLYDAAAVLASFLVVRALVPPRLTAFSQRAGSLGGGLLIAGVTVAGFWLAGLYRGSYLRAGVPELLRTVRAVVVGVLLGGGAGAALFRGAWSPVAWLLHFYLVLSAVMSARLLFRFLDYVHQRARRSATRVLIVGAGRGGELAVREMLANPALNLAPAGFVDDDPRLAGARVHGYPVYGGTDAVERALAAARADRVVLSTNKLPAARLAALVAACAARGMPLLQLNLTWQTLDAAGTALAAQPAADAETA
jgi:UDP-GlcNAc:undecaprenyl-phosphate GlcNAc-1-phosphate transferase